MARIAVRWVRIDARRVFNLTAPRWLPDAAKLWTDRAAWFSPHADAARDILEQTYIDGFNERTGHYRRLEKSIAREGVYNPVMLSTGWTPRDEELPPAVRADRKRVVCHYVGGSRLLVAARLGLDIPAIVNDRENVFPEAVRIMAGTPMASWFRDKPRRIEWRKDGSLFCNFFDYGHFPREERAQRRAEQIQVRREVIGECLAAVNLWRILNGNP